MFKYLARVAVSVPVEISVIHFKLSLGLPFQYFITFQLSKVPSVFAIEVYSLEHSHGYAFHTKC